jgi:hypothetical protein
MHVCRQLIIFVSPNEKKKTRLYWLLAYNLLFFQAYDAKHVKKNIFLPSLDLVDWQTNIRLIGP